ncbi:uncharacterized protein O3C94_013524 [Discoglossus pictus]
MLMNTFPMAMEVNLFVLGAEVELQECETVDQSSIVLENKQDLPSWQTLQNFDASSDDEASDTSATLSSKLAPFEGPCRRQPEPHTCQECQRVFYRYSAYATHRRWHIKRASYLQFKSDHQVIRSDGMENSKSMIVNGEFTKTEGAQKFLTEDGARLLNVCQKCACYCKKKNNLIRHLDWHMRHGFSVSKNEKFNSELVVKAEDDDDDEKAHYTLNSEDDKIMNRDLPEANCKIEDNMEQVDEHTISNSYCDFETKEQKCTIKNAFPLHIQKDRLVHIAKRPKPLYRCRDCGVRFYQVLYLNRHLKRGKMRRGKTRKKYKCNCGRSPLGTLHFLRHQLNHLTATAFICATCGLSLRGYRQLRAHSWLHPLVTHFLCSCGAVFNQLPRYMWHSLLNSMPHRRRNKKVKQV